MADIDLDGQTYFHDRTSRRELMNRLAVQVDLERAVFVVGTASDDRASELVFDDPATRRAVTQVVDAMRRRVPPSAGAGGTETPAPVRSVRGHTDDPQSA